MVIAGGHGQIALRLTALLAGRGDLVTGVVRNPDHRGDVEAAGGTVLVFDLEAGSATDLAEHLVGADAVVFAAGAGPTSGAPRKDTVDRAAAGLLADAAELAGVRRYVQVSAINVDEEPDASRGEVWVAYVHAKRAAEEALRATTLDWTILRPGALTDDPGVGKVLLAPSARTGRSRATTRPRVLAAVLDSPGTIGQTLELARATTTCSPPSRRSPCRRRATMRTTSPTPPRPRTPRRPARARRGRVPDVTREVDVVVIGAGRRRRERRRLRAPRRALAALIVESELVGGECSYWACMPSKALLRTAARRRRRAPAARRHGRVRRRGRAEAPRLDRPGWDDASQVEWAEGAGIRWSAGRARLAGEPTVEVGADGRTR